jgi:hypothetical protein
MIRLLAEAMVLAAFMLTLPTAVIIIGMAVGG